MNDHLLTPADLAHLFGVTERKVMEWRRAHRWPFVKVGRTFRFTPEQVELIIAGHSVTQVKAKTVTAPAAIAGQTARSARRSS